MKIFLSWTKFENNHFSNKIALKHKLATNAAMYLHEHTYWEVINTRFTRLNIF